MAQNLPEIGMLPKLGVKIDKNVHKYKEFFYSNREGWYFCNPTNIPFQVGSETMHPVLEHVNTLGIDCLIQRLTEYIYEYETKLFSNPECYN